MSTSFFHVVCNFHTYRYGNVCKASRSSPAFSWYLGLLLILNQRSSPQLFETLISVPPLIFPCILVRASPSANWAVMGERRTHSFHMTCHVQRDYGSRMASSFISCRPNGYASTSLSTAAEFEAPDPAATSSSGLLSPTHSKSRYSPVSLELEPTDVNNGSGIPHFPAVVTTEPAEKKTTGNRPSVISIPPPLPRSSWLHHHQKDFQSPYIKTSMQGDVYNFLERPAGLKCFLYHFLVWVHCVMTTVWLCLFLPQPSTTSHPPIHLLVQMQKKKSRKRRPLKKAEKGSVLLKWEDGARFIVEVNQTGLAAVCQSVAVPGLLITSSFTSSSSTSILSPHVQSLL